MSHKYLVKDSEENILRVFYTYKEASLFKFVKGNYKWSIEEV